MYNIFFIKSVEFEHQKEDPFGLDSVASKIADKYLSFSGSIRKPIYLFFVAYVNELLQSNRLYSKEKQKNDTKTRLEKLLVLTWKRAGAARGESIIGSRLRNINPFVARDGNWVIQNCFKIYEASSRKFHIEEVVKQYCNQHIYEIKYLNDFLNKTGHISTHELYLSEMVSRLRKKRTSIFSGKTILSPALKSRLLKQLKKILMDGYFNKDEILIKKLFSKPSKAQSVLSKVLQSKKYPFYSYNQWVKNLVLAVDADISGKYSEHLWKDSDLKYENLLLPVKVGIRPIPQCWIQLKNNRYCKGPDFNYSGWDAIVRRAKRSNSIYYDFRLTALESLLQELS